MVFNQIFKQGTWIYNTIQNIELKKGPWDLQNFKCPSKSLINEWFSMKVFK